MPIETLNSSPPPPPHPFDHQPVGASVKTLHRDTPGGGGAWGSHATVVGVIFLIAALIVGGRYLYVSQQNKNFSATITDLEQQYAGLKETETKANDIQALSVALSGVYQSQLNYTSLLKKLEETTYNSVRYSSVSLDIKGQVVLNGRVGSYLEFAKMVKAFKEKGAGEPITKDVVINSVTQEGQDLATGGQERSTTFSVSFTLDPTLLLPAHQAPAPIVAAPAAETPAESTGETPTEAPTDTTTTPQATELPEGTL